MSSHNFKCPNIFSEIRNWLFLVLLSLCCACHLVTGRWWWHNLHTVRTLRSSYWYEVQPMISASVVISALSLQLNPVILNEFAIVLSLTVFQATVSVGCASLAGYLALFPVPSPCTAFLYCHFMECITPKSSGCSSVVQLCGKTPLRCYVGTLYLKGGHNRVFSVV